MKKIIFILFLIKVNVFVAQTNIAYDPNKPVMPPSEKSNAENIPPNIIKKFMTNYPDINATWNKEGNNYSVLYYDEGTKMGRIIIYDKDANVIQTDSEINDLDYPQPIGEYYSKNYPNESYKIWISRDNTGTKRYYTKRNQMNIWFDSKGNYLTTKQTNQ